MPALTLPHFKRAGLVVRAVPEPQLRREIFLVRRVGRSLSIAAQALSDL